MPTDIDTPIIHFRVAIDSIQILFQREDRGEISFDTYLIGGPGPFLVPCPRLAHCGLP